MTQELSAEDCRTRYVARLESERAELVAQTHTTDADRKPVMLDQQSVGRLSRMDALQGQAMAHALQTRRDGRLRAIDAALERLGGEDFGWCDDCGEFVGIKRLDLDPCVQRCVDCST